MQIQADDIDTAPEHYRLPVGRVSIADLAACAEFLSARAVMILGHPGHCLRAFGWMREARPLCQILTDGSGLTASARIESSRRTMESVGASPGALFGRFSDRRIYSAILNSEHSLFIDLANELADVLVKERVDYVVGDAAEGIESTHDVMRLVIDSAVRKAEARSSREIPQYDFVLDGPPDVCPPHLIDHSTILTLTDEALESKLAAAANYPELADEVERALNYYGRDAFRIECLRPVFGAGKTGVSPGSSCDTPYYETYAETQVKAGRFACAIRYDRHIAPLEAALQQNG